MFKIVLTDKRAVLHTLLVNDIAPKRELPDDIGAPLAELGCTDEVNTIAHRNDCIEVVELCHVVLTICGSCRVFLGN